MNTTETLPEHVAPSDGDHSSPPHFLVGRNRHGQWVVREQHSRSGSLFNSRAEALRFAFRERGEAAGAVVLVPEALELLEAPSTGAAAPDQNEARAAATRILLEV
jgi:hypothetical protein